MDNEELKRRSFLRSLEGCYYKISLWGFLVWIKRPFINNAILKTLVEQMPDRDGWVPIGYTTGDIRKGTEKFHYYRNYKTPHLIIG